MNRKRIIIICPGRGSYTRETQGYLKKYIQSSSNKIKYMDNERNNAGLPTLTEIDSQTFKARVHMKGEHASTLIYACSLIDYYSIDQSKYKIVAIIGNSMGWYSALAFSESLHYQKAYGLINIMGSMMKDQSIGGQIIYSITDDNWNINNDLMQKCMKEIKEAGAQISIYLGGYIVIGAEQKALNMLLKRLPKKGNYPFQLPYHAAFHTPLLQSISKKAKRIFSRDMFLKPQTPIIDGRGYIWSPWSTNETDLWNYTLGHQVCNPYDFTKSLSVAIKEFSPDKIVLLGPGNTLGGAIGQIICQLKWKNISCKEDFVSTQNENPFLISMGIPDQREIISQFYENPIISS